MKWVWIVTGVAIGLPILLYLGTFAYFNVFGNDQVAQELKDKPEGERAEIVMLLRMPDGREMPVNYLREGSQVFVGSDGGWWRSLRDGDVQVEAYIKGQAHAGTARVVLDDPEYTHDVFSRLRPSAPAWLPDWLNGKLVVIELKT